MARTRNRATRIARVIVAIWTLILFSVLLGWSIYGYNASSRLEREISLVRAAGEPLRPEDFQVDPLPPSESNRYLEIPRIGALIDTKSEVGRLQTELDRTYEDAFAFGALSELERRHLEAWIEQNREVLEQLDGAAKLKSCSFVTVPSTKMFGMFDLNLEALRNGIYLRLEAASLAVVEGDFSTAWRHLDAIDPIVEVAAITPGMMAQLISRGGEAARDEAIVRWVAITPDEQVDRSRIEAIINRLLDESSVHARHRLSVFGDRATTLDAIDQLRKDKKSWTGSPIFGPIHDDNAAYVLAHFREAMPRMALSTLKDRRAFVKANPTSLESKADSRRLFVANIFVVDVERMAVSFFRAQAERRSTAVALAIRLYRLDHNDAFPPTLDALVPAYLPSIPVDPFDGKPLRYDPQRKRVWTVGDDLQDDGGFDRTDLDFSVEQPRGIRRTDHVVFLDPESNSPESIWRRDRGDAPVEWLFRHLPGEYTEHGAASPRTLTISVELQEAYVSSTGSETVALSMVAAESTDRPAFRSRLSLTPESRGIASLVWETAGVREDLTLCIPDFRYPSLIAIRTDAGIAVSEVAERHFPAGVIDAERFIFQADEVVLDRVRWLRVSK